MDTDLLRQRKAAEQDLDDAKLLYRFRVAALLGGEKLRCAPGDRVKVGDEEGRVLRVEESPEEPELISVRFFSDERIEQVQAGDLKVVAPHRPGVLLGEEELKNRLEGELQDAREPRGLETLGEVARRRMKEGIPEAIKLFEEVEDAPCDDLRKALTAILRSRPFGEVEVALRHLETHPADEDLVELPALAAAAPESDHAREILDRFERMESAKQAVQVAKRAGKGLVGLGGPAFLRAEARERVEELTRKHPEKAVRVALFANSGVMLMKEEELTAAFASDSPEVRGAAAIELLRRGSTAPVLELAQREEEESILHAILRDAPAPLPLELCERLLDMGKKRPVLTDHTLVRLAESTEDGALDLLSPWLGKKPRKTNAAGALWCAGLLGRAEAGDSIAALLGAGKLDERAVPLAVEALARLEHDAATAALDTWGASIMRTGSAGEEVVDAVGLLVGHTVDARELLGRFLVAGPAGPVRKARALDVGRWLHGRGQVDAARPVSHFLPSTLPRFKELSEAFA